MILGKKSFLRIILIVNISPSFQQNQDLTNDVTRGKYDNDVDLKAMVKDEIDLYHNMKIRIQELQEHLQKHASFHLIPSSELEQAEVTLEAVKDKIIRPLEQNLLAVRDQVGRLNHSLTQSERHFVQKLIANSDIFLQKAMERINRLETIEQVWERAEETENHNENLVVPQPASAHVESIPEKRVEIQQIPKNPQLSSKLVLNSSFSQPSPRGLEMAVSAHYRTLNPAQRMAINVKRMRYLKEKKKAVKAVLEGEMTSIAGKEELAKEHLNDSVDLKKVKEQIELEQFSDSHQVYSQKIKEALADAAQKSHEFVENKLIQATGARRETARTQLFSFHLLLLTTFSLIGIILVFAVYRTKRGTVQKDVTDRCNPCDSPGLTEMGRNPSPGYSGWTDSWTTWETAGNTAAARSKANKLK